MLWADGLADNSTLEMPATTSNGAVSNPAMF
jgi:hypothetical protein